MILKKIDQKLSTIYNQILSITITNIDLPSIIQAFSQIIIVIIIRVTLPMYHPKYQGTIVS